MSEPPATSDSDSGHDISLVSRFVGLSPDQGLAELESRVAFFHSLRAGHDTQLPPYSGSSQKHKVEYIVKLFM